MPHSQNGYSANDTSLMTRYHISGTTRDVTLRRGPTGALLAHWAAWYSENIERIDQGIYDDWGYASRPIRGSTTTLSNHASGTAIDLNATRHPLGRIGTFLSIKAFRIRAELRKYDGCIRWGGDYHGRKDEMHFEIVASEPRCAAVLRKLTTTNPSPPTPAPEEDDMPYTEAQLREIVKSEVSNALEDLRFEDPSDKSSLSLRTAIRRLLGRTHKLL